MKVRSNYGWKNAVLFSILTVLFFGISKFPNYLSEVKQYDQKISSFSDASGAEISLPTTHFMEGDHYAVSISGEFSTSIPTQEIPRVLYIPFYVGSLKLFANEIVLYDFSEQESPQHITSTRNALIEVPWAKLTNPYKTSDSVKISFQVQNDRGGLAAISNIYIGQPSDFEKPQLLYYLYHDVFRLCMLGAQFVLLILLCFALTTRSLGFEALPPILVLAFFFIFGIGKVANINSGFVLLSQAAFSFAPLVVLAIFKLFTDIKAQDLERGLKRGQILAAISTVLPILVLAFGFVELIDYNMFVSAPFLLFGILTLSIVTISNFIKSQRTDIGLWAISSSLACYAILFDALFRFGLTSTPANISAVTFPIFIVIIAASFMQLTLSKKAALAMANESMKKALDVQSRKLQEEFELSVALQKRAAVAEEKDRLTVELHDGVLTYLSMINAMSENSKDTNLEKINKLSRNALNEIRIILEARPSDLHSLTIALGALRAQLVDPLLYMGVKVEWSTHALLDHGAIQPKALMEIIRIIQEAIHNAVIRGKCTFLSVVAQSHDSEFTITIVNKGGQAFNDKNRKGMGVLNMVSRAARIGGALKITPNGSGAILVLSVPNVDKCDAKIKQASEQ